jgi:hypothetical protein
VSEAVTVQLPTELARQARAVAAATNRRLEDAVVEWIERAISDPPVESLSDADLLIACDSRLPEGLQDELSALLIRNREETLPGADRARLDDLLGAYRRGLVLKARAWKEAVARGLKPRLGDHAA